MSAKPLASLFVALLLCGSLAAHGQTTLPAGAGKEILQSACTGCHEIGRVLRAGYSAQDCRTNEAGPKHTRLGPAFVSVSLQTCAHAFGC